MKTFFAIVTVALCCLASAPARASESASQCSTQVDGIMDKVVDKLWGQADEYFHKGDYPRIIAVDRIITQADPYFVECYSTGGWLMESLGNMNDAEAFYQQGVRNNPTSSAMYYSLGMFYYNTLHDYHAATAVYLADVNKSQSADVNDWKMLAHSYERLGNLKMAVATWKEIKARWPNGPAVQANLNRVLAAQHAATTDLMHTP
jgi:tetratricopeptide (TPR) repeat protein